MSEDTALHLYLARLEREQGTLFPDDSGEHPRPVALFGEILVAGYPDQNQALFITEIRRLSIWSEPLERVRGIISLAGPVDEIKIEAGPAGSMKSFDMWLYYSLLGDLKPECGESDAVYPQLERLQGSLSWEPEKYIDAKSLNVRVTLVLDTLIDRRIGAIEQVAFGPSVLTFRQLEDPKTIVPTPGPPVVFDVAPPLTLCSAAAPPAPIVPPSDIHDVHPQYALHIRFVSLSMAVPLPADLNPLAQDLINGACTVWWEKGGIAITPEPDIAQPLSSPGATLTLSQEANLPILAPLAVSDASVAVEVYLADKLLGDSTYSRDGGGVTYKCASSDAYVILEIEKARHNHYLLAHELGHVLGLTHPLAAGGAGCPGHPAGSDCSVMVPDRPNSSRNTAANLLVASTFPIGPVFTTRESPPSTPLQCGWRADSPQGFFHIIRDFSYDDGNQPSAPADPIWWTQSDVWNSDQPPLPASPIELPNQYINHTPMFDADNVPIHTEPTFTGPNHMYVRLHTCQALAQPVNIYLFLAVPGAASSPLIPVSAGPLVFSSALNPLPTPGTPKTGHITWNVPTGYPPHCCVFAVAVSGNEATPLAITAIITSPAAHTFYDLFAFVASSNDVAQRNLHIQGISPAPGMSASSMLAWLEISNPFKEAAPARLEVDTSSAAQLERLALEVNDEVVGEMKIGEATSFVLAEALQPGEHRVLRLRATLPPNLPEGTQLPINLRFFVNDQLISGYQHVLRVVPLSEAVARVLDTLFGALRDVAVGCKVDAAQDLAERVRNILSTEQIRTGPPRGCLDQLYRGWLSILWRIFGYTPPSWRSGLRSLAEGVASLAQSPAIAAGSEPDYQAVRLRLDELSGILRMAEDTASPNLLIEQIRESSDRIQVPAERLAQRA